MRRKRFYVTFLMFAFFMAFVNVSCKRQEDPYAYLYKLPDATSCGANTFGCICNGDIYSVRREIEGVMFGSWPNDIKVDIGPYYINIKAKAQLETLPKSWIGFSLLCEPQKIKPGKYIDVFRSVSGSENYVNITRFDRYVVAGTFKFNKYSLQRIPGITLEHEPKDWRLDDTDSFGCRLVTNDSIIRIFYNHVDSTVKDIYVEGRFDIQLDEENRMWLDYLQSFDTLKFSDTIVILGK